VTAAHRPSSLDTQQVPKELIQFNGNPLIVYCLDHLAAAGITDIVLVVAKNGERVAHAVLEWAKTRRARVQIVMMPTCFCHASSIVAARRLLPDEFLLVTGDHVFDPQLIQCVANKELARSDNGTVLVDFDLHSKTPGVADTGVFVEAEASRIIRIGRSKNVPPACRNGVEAGMFLLRKHLVETLIDLSTLQPYYTLADALAVAASHGQLSCESVRGKPWLCFETIAQLQAASSFRSAADQQHAQVADECGSIPVGELVDGIVEVADSVCTSDQLQRVVSIIPTEANHGGSAQSPQKRRRE
jgi:NDP-sugar pyrophosphorylase family protein